jgi:transcriptional regulator with XRE-family HTH domain
MGRGAAHGNLLKRVAYLSANTPRIGALREIRALRLEAEFTFDALVEETGLGRGHVSELERGTVVPTIGTLAKVASALQLTLADRHLAKTSGKTLR